MLTIRPVALDSLELDPGNARTQWAFRVPRVRGLPGYADREALRLLTEGAIGRDGKALKPPMPPFRMTRQDAADVIAHLRSLE